MLTVKCFQKSYLKSEKSINSLNSHTLNSLHGVLGFGVFGALGLWGLGPEPCGRCAASDRSVE